MPPEKCMSVAKKVRSRKICRFAILLFALDKSAPSFFCARLTRKRYAKLLKKSSTAIISMGGVLMGSLRKSVAKGTVKNTPKTANHLSFMSQRTRSENLSLGCLIFIQYYRFFVRRFFTLKISSSGLNGLSQ